MSTSHGIPRLEDIQGLVIDIVANRTRKPASQDTPVSSLTLYTQIKDDVGSRLQQIKAIATQLDSICVLPAKNTGPLTERGKRMMPDLTVSKIGSLIHQELIKSAESSS